jgi:hypothetical protein
MLTRLLRFVVVAAVFLLAAAADRAASATPRCVVVNGLSYCCWSGGMCRVCDSENCYLLPGSECPQSCPS